VWVVDSLALNLFHIEIIKYRKILKIKNEKKKRAATIDWLVDCTLNKYTFSAGIEDLSNEVLFSNVKPEHFYKDLSENQRLKMDSLYNSDGMFANDSTHRKEISFVNLVSEKIYPKLKEHLINYLKASTTHDYARGTYMEIIIKISPPNPKLKEIKEEFKTAFSQPYSSINYQAEDQIVANFVAEASRK